MKIDLEMGTEALTIGNIFKVSPMYIDRHVSQI